MGLLLNICMYSNAQPTDLSGALSDATSALPSASGTDIGGPGDAVPLRSSPSPTLASRKLLKDPDNRRYISSSCKGDCGQGSVCTQQNTDCRQSRPRQSDT
jgi:hypothetical protein